MLVNILALVIALASLAIYMAAFFFPEIHRKEDFIWSGVGLFYALVLWVCAGRITGGVLLGQLASTALLGWFGWQTLTLRRALTPAEQQTPIPSQDKLQAKLKGLSPGGSFQGLQEQVTSLFRKGKSKAKSTPKPVDAKVTPPVVTVIDSTTIQTEPSPAEASTTEVTPETKEESKADSQLSQSPELVRPNPPNSNLVESSKNSAPSDAPQSSEKAATPVEEIAPEVELAPPAEPPGRGDPEDRQAET